MGIAPGRRWFCKSCRKSFDEERLSSRAQERLGPVRFSRGGMIGTPPLGSPLPSALPSPPNCEQITSRCLHSKLPRSGAAVGVEARTQNGPSRLPFGSSAPAQKRVCPEVKGLVSFPFPQAAQTITAYLPTPQSQSFHLEAAVLRGWLGRKVRAGASEGG